MELLDLGTAPLGQLSLEAYLGQCCDRLELDHIAYAGINPIANQIHGAVTYQPDWVNHYTTRGFQRIDPTLHMAARSIAPLDWRRLERNPQFIEVFSEARDFGISDRGLTIPVRGPYGDIGLLSVTRDCSEAEWDSLRQARMGDLQSLAVHIHDSLMQSDDLTRSLRSPALSNREREILQWIAAGKTQQDIGDILGISHRTVEVHLRSTRDKLCALTTPQAVSRAIALRLIYPG